MKQLFSICLLTLSCIYVQAQQKYYNPTRPIDPAAPVSEKVKEAPLYGKSMVIIGDSYVRNHRRPIEETWHYKVAEKYRMTYHNYGKNGNCVAFDRTKRGFGIPMYQRYTEMTDSADYVILIAGHNDADFIAQRDSAMTDEAYAQQHDSRLQEFRLRLDQLLDSLIVKYPSAKMAFITPWNVDRPGFPEVLNALQEICARYSVPVYDAAHESGIYVRNEEFRRRYFQRYNDTAHLNAAGHDLFMNKAETFLLGL